MFNVGYRFFCETDKFEQVTLYKQKEKHIYSNVIKNSSNRGKSTHLLAKRLNTEKKSFTNR
jgi:hypothetical protein